MKFCDFSVFSTKIYLSFLPIPTGFSEAAVCSLQWYRCRMVSPIPVRAVFNNRLSESISNGGFIIRIAPSYSKGRPIWFVSGSPLSGSHACSSVDSKCKTHKSVLNGRFRDVWRSFVEVNTRYDEAKSRFMAYSLEKVIFLLNEKTGTD